MFSLLHGIFAILHAAFFLWGIRLYGKVSNWALGLFLAIALGLAYDNFVVAFGSSLGIGDTLKNLSFFRFAIHAFLTPTMLLVAWNIGKEHGLSLPNAKIMIGITLALVALGSWQGLVSMDLQPACHNDTLRYAERLSENQLCMEYSYPADIIERRGMPPLASIITIIGIAIIGGMVWRKSGWVWMCLAAIAMFITAAIPASVVGLWLGNAGEVILLLGMLLSLAKIAQSRLVVA